MSVCLLEIEEPQCSEKLELWANDYTCHTFRIDDGDDMIYLDRADAIRIAEAIMEWGRK